MSSQRISPTAHATGYFWYRHGLSHPALATRQGRRIDRAFRLLGRVIRRLSGVSIDALMLARHRGIDEVLAGAIEAGRVQQVIEIAAGLSPRGWAFARRFGDAITYLETDLPAMAALKARLLGEAGLLSARHRVTVLDALADSGPDSLAGIAATLDPKLGTAIITEGLMNYLSPQTAALVWQRIATTLARFPNGLYLMDAYPQAQRPPAPVLLFGAAISAFVRGRMHIHFDSAQSIIDTLSKAGFAKVEAHETASLSSTREFARTPGGDRVRIVEART